MTHHDPADPLASYPPVIRGRLQHAPHREMTGFPPGYDQEYEVLLEQSPENATDAELDTVRLIRQHLDPAFTVANLRTNRTHAIAEARSTANLLEIAGAHDCAATYKMLADVIGGQHARVDPARTLPCRSRTAGS